MRMTCCGGNDLTGSSLLSLSPDQAPDAFFLEVSVLTLNAIIHDFAEGRLPCLIKLDLQGFELEALMGACECLGVTEVIIVETALYEFAPGQPTFEKVIAFMAGSGYEMYDIGDVFRRPTDGALGCLDLIFVLKGSPLVTSKRWR